MEHPLSLIKRRTWPQPLWLHLSSAWNCLSSSVNGWMSSQPNANPLRPNPQSENPSHGKAQNKTLSQKQKQQQNAHAHVDPIAVAQALSVEAASQWRDFLKGIYLYQNSTTTRHTDDWDVVARHHAVALKLLNPAKTSKTSKSRKPRPALVLIPSLINRFHILDLHPQHSFARFMHDAGYDVYLLDWHHDLTQALPTTLESSICDYILPLCAKIPQKHYHMLGYCMGGTLAIAAAQLNPGPIQSLTLLATPWDFHKPDAILGRNLSDYITHIQNQHPTTHFKAYWLQILFWRHDPLTALHKFKRFANLDPHSLDAPLFTLTEDWLNDGVDLPLSLLAECANEWYAKNTPSRHTWKIAKQIISPDTLTMPLHIITAERDGLVPPESSAALTTHNQAVHHLFHTGHIGLFAGSQSKNSIWPQVQHILSGHNTR
jgi:polyhydroxyalkanoate synthase